MATAKGTTASPRKASAKRAGEQMPGKDEGEAAQVKKVAKPRKSETGEKPARAAKPAIKADKPAKAAKPAKEDGPAKAKRGAATPPSAAAAPAGEPMPQAVPRKPRAKAAQVTPAGIAAQQRLHYIQVAAYYIAERRGFHGGSPEADWVQAEREIDLLLAQGRLPAD